MRKILFCLILLAAVPIAAETIKGRVTDENGQPMSYVTISALQSDSTLITGAITDENGEYSLDAPASSILQASFVGYNTMIGGPDFTLKEETEQLEEVQVKAKRPLIERQMDKIVVNVSESPLAAGSSLTKVLQRAPGVRVDKDGNVTVNGKSVEIYIDGRPSYMSGEQLKALLNGTDGGTIEKIEIITNPSAKYDAAGSGGIINIKLKKNKMQGFNGSFVANYGGMYFGDIKRWLSQDYVSLNLNYRGKKTYTNVQLTQVYVDISESQRIGVFTPDTSSVTYNNIIGGFQNYNLQVSNDFMIDSVNTLGFIFRVPVTNLKYGCEENKTASLMPQHTANLNFTHVFDENLDREITANIDYNRNNSDSHNMLYYERKIDGNRANVVTDQVVDIVSAKLDFQTHFWQTGMIECGVKYAFSNTNNRMTTDSVMDGIQRPAFNNDFSYAENVAAAYITAAKQFGQKVNLKLGLRGEYTYSVGHWITADSVNKYSYFNLFPTAFVGYNPTDKWSISATYTRRIKRPSYRVLNPFKDYIDAHHCMSGNPSLTPEFNNDVQVNFGWSQYISVAGIFSHTQDMLNLKMEIYPNGDGAYRWYNFGTCTTHGVNASFTEIPLVPKFETDENGKRSVSGAWLAMTLNAGYYNFINKAYDGNYFNQNHFWNLNANLTAYLPKFWTLSVDGNYSGECIIGYNHESPNYSMAVGLRKMFPQKGVILNLNVQDLLRSSNYFFESMGMAEGQYGYQYTVLRQQKVTLTVVWNFGKQEWHKARKVGDMDENSRLGGGNSIGGNK